VRLCLAGHLLAQWRDLERRLAEAAVPKSLGERSEAGVIAEQMESLRTQMRDAEHAFLLRAMPPQDWAAFYSTKPVRGRDEDADTWRNRWFAWLCDLVSRCAIEPEMTADQVAQLCDVLSGEQWDELTDCAWNLNGERVSIPFSAAASALIQHSPQASRRPSDSESPTPSSSAPRP
jgi:hypothetical protein